LQITRGELTEKELVF